MRFAFIVALALAFNACVPWTIRPIGETESKAQQNNFNARSYVESIWSSKLLPAINAEAVDLSEAVKSNAPGKHYMVKGRARVLKIDTTSRVGRAALDLLPADGKPDAFLQIGPVLQGTALRDAPGFIQFGQFVNQIDHAQVANELNAKVLATILTAEKVSAIKGKTIEFQGAFTALQSAPPLIVPVRLEVQP